MLWLFISQKHVPDAMSKRCVYKSSFYKDDADNNYNKFVKSISLSGCELNALHTKNNKGTDSQAHKKQKHQQMADTIANI